MDKYALVFWRVVCGGKRAMPSWFDAIFIRQTYEEDVNEN